jgi:hypothetical protein
VTAEPRLGATAPIVTGVVRRIFQHRHARLRARFGVVPTIGKLCELVGWEKLIRLGLHHA